MPEQLFLVSIGPVQEFIAAARRSRDLWFGSWLLSELAKAAALTIVDSTWEGKLVFPALDSSALRDETQNAPNRILAKLDAALPAEKLGDAVIAAVQIRLAALRRPVLEGIDWPTDRPFLKQLAQAQLDDLLAGLMFWAATPLEPDYTTARKRLEALMAGRKRTRDFGPSPIVQVSDPLSPESLLRLPKSALDGTRESVIDERLFAQRNDSPQERRRKATYLYEQYRARPAERMSGVDLLKRRGQPGSTEADIPSTSHFAALPLLQRVSNNLDAATIAECAKVFEWRLRELADLGARPQLLAERYRKLSLIGVYDAGILFPERLAEEIDRVDLPQARGVLLDLLKATTNGKAPEPYYALLAADGDFMGDTIDRFTTAEAHHQFSRALSSFAVNVRAIVEKQHQGALVYAGGDDLLAFLPLHTALDCAWELTKNFNETIKSVIAQLQQDMRPSPDQALPPSPPSLSVGIVIAHHIEPLADTLQLARDTEQFAKQLPGKNALAITLSKRSGVDRRIRGRWGGDGGAFFLRIKKFVALHRVEVIPDGAAYELRNLAERLGNAPTELRDELETAMRVNAVGIFQRKRGRRGEAKVAAHVIDDLRLALGLAPGNTEPIDVATLADELIIAREFARALGPDEHGVAAVPEAH